MKVVDAKRSIAMLLLALSAVCQGQAGSAAAADGSHLQDPSSLLQRIDTLDAAVSQAQQQLAEAHREVVHLRQEVQQLREQTAHTTVRSSPDVADEASSSSAAVSTSPQAPLEEREQSLEAAVKLHEQSKVESSSKYPVQLTGLVLFNGFLDRGQPDNIDLPSVAIQTASTSSVGSFGASLRQTILGLEADGPRFAGARTTASVALDFFSGVAPRSYGTAAGAVRMRTAAVDLLWRKDSIQVGQVAPLISPLSPSSFATVAEPALAGAGNLWTWSPQLRVAHRMDLSDNSRLQVELGLWDAANAGYNTSPSYRITSPAEASRQPAYESRLSYGRVGENSLQLGIGGYYGRLAYPGYGVYGTTTHLDAWASTFDWRVPAGRHFEVSGEAYRGRSLGGLGGGTYKDALAGTSLVSGAKRILGLNAIGGWAQAKARFGQTLEANASVGQDDGFASDFHALLLPSTATAAQLNARNRMAIGNLIFHPKTYLILSPEYRRIWSWPIQGHAATVNVMTLAVGYQF